jgi:ribosomal protein S18 acetylase RimI-like enzyme
VVDRYPAHLHIDLLPRAQGHGLGRALVTTLTDALRERGVPGLHLGVDPANTGALAFYARIGMVPVPTADGGTVQALDLRGPRPA